MTLDHRATSREIAQHTRQQAAWADDDVREFHGQPRKHLVDDPADCPPRGFPWAIMAVVGIAGLALGYLTAPDIATLAPSETFINCYTEGC